MRPNTGEGIVIPETSTRITSLTGTIRESDGFITDKFRLSNVAHDSGSFHFTFLGEVKEEHREYADTISRPYDRTERAIRDYFKQ